MVEIINYHLKAVSCQGIYICLGLTECSIDKEFFSKNGIIITAGQDSRVGLYNTSTEKKYFLQKDFLVFSAALNEDGSIGAYTATEDNDISIFETQTQKEMSFLA